MPFWCTVGYCIATHATKFWMLISIIQLIVFSCFAYGAFMMYCRFWCTLNSLFHEIVIHSRTVCSRLGDNYASKCSSNNFQHTTYMSPCLENCQNHTLMFGCNPIPGIRFKKLVFLLFMTFSPQLETNNTLQCSSDSFPRMVTYILCVENCQNYIWTHSCLPIAGRLF